MSGPLPPADLDRRLPELVKLPAGQEVHRFFTAKWEPIFFDRSTEGRFNAPNASYGVLYAAKEINGAFAETFLRTPGRTLIDTDLLQRKAYVRIIVQRDLKLIRLAGPGLARLGATAEVAHGGLPYDVPQAWSTALAGHPIGADGIAYHARHDDVEVCYALFERSADAIAKAAREIDLDQDWFWRVAERYRVGLAP
ncbi:RES family NAD+ phosphorylase [Mesorhizobium sp.]|uniref:RES family NAD+ phosphorylase n=1 Tax=Mesorhizobium sp. TaxID=1871066 RepID=UPI000FE4BEC3|nr:RES family NAD+ phosphorylase [Mesorhizobium sp.]RWI22073.1 MAG: RES domain-containing protein [Mesorhizobium sp.]RWK45987.1 MAG: RES domain-containing protein [Mesorhizobium sp.]RWK76199.1 MAG: RES domain-containing protein [Mesorhizobium sp.]RWK95166.1 MAG: RES domain-containing protein [Mesorhizobium sp.]TIP58066.1 MAG: RES domain-containing protein [Mesorhizobium sp.]